MAECRSDPVDVDEPIAHGRPPLRGIGFLAKMVAGLALLFVIIGTAGHYYRDDLQRLGTAFVDSMGYLGMGVGTFIADGLHFPIPPQFYMLASVTGGASPLLTLAAISVGSIAGGHVAYYIAMKASRLKFILRRAAKVKTTMAAVVERWGTWAMVLGSLLPVPYSFLCYLSGLNRLPYPLFAILCVLRIPKIVAYFYLIRLGWSF
ncbi:MAG: hypothetical protein HOW73_33465 [Polyangiaceae bacterium]|nr:hypothetical protein [Polyangiaceae bacterium]